MMRSTVVNDIESTEPAVGLSDPPSARATVYAILSACFSPPDAELLEGARSGALAAALAGALAELPAERERLGAALETFEALQEELVPDGSHGTMGDLEIEYTRLFLGPGLPVVPPYESVYADREDANALGPLWGPATIAVRAAYHDAGLTPRPGPEPPDHLAAELEFIAFLSQREDAALDRGDPRQAEGARRRRTSFLREHLSRWALAVADKVSQDARHPLYKAAGGLLRAVLTAEG